MNYSNSLTADESRGLFICLEGIDGAGKTTQCDHLKQWAEARDISCDIIGWDAAHESEMIRELTHSPLADYDDAALAMLFSAQRITLARVVKDSWAKHDLVISDRWLMSTLVYQAFCGSADTDLVYSCHKHGAKILPDIGIYLDIDGETSKQRKLEQFGDQAGQDRFERHDAAWFDHIRLGYCEVAEQINYHRIDASQKFDKVFEDILEACNEHARFTHMIAGHVSTT